MNSAYEFGDMDQHVAFVPDGNLVMEWNVMEILARRISDKGMDSYFCHEYYHQYQCLDIGAFSTLSNTLSIEDTSADGVADVSNLYQTFTYTNETNLFGQLEMCRSKVVGDGTLGVFDLAVLLAYIFKDDGYDTLSEDASTVTTVEGRDGLRAMCGNEMSSVEYLIASADQCYLMDDAPPPPPLSLPSPSSRRLAEFDSADSPVWMMHMPPYPPPSPSPFPATESYLFTRTDTYNVWMKHVVLPQGTWYTINLDTIPLRTYLVVDADITAKLSNEVFDRYSPPQYNPRESQVMFTRQSETTLFDSLRRSVKFSTRSSTECSTITTPYSDMYGIYKGEIQLMQDDIRIACQYYLHIWVPVDMRERRKLSNNGEDRLNILYVELTDGNIGHRSSSVVRSETFEELPPPPPPSFPSIEALCYTNATGYPMLMSYMNNNAPLGLSDVLTLLRRNVTSNVVPSGFWDTRMMDMCGDWNSDSRIDLSDVLGILRFSMGNSRSLYPGLHRKF